MIINNVERESNREYKKLLFEKPTIDWIFVVVVVDVVGWKNLKRRVLNKITLRVSKIVIIDVKWKKNT